jgi:hypothetical protein
LLTKEDCEEDKGSNIEYLEVFESLAVQANKGGHDKDRKESDGQPDHVWI